jgi:hypothetical protein
MPYILNGETADIGEPRLQDGTMFVPLRKLAQALGGSADYEPSTHSAILYLNDQIVTFTNGQNNVSLNGSEVTLQAAPFAEEGETWVPVRFFESVMGYKLSADPTNSIVELSAS